MNLLNTDGLSALDCAIYGKHRGLVNYLESNGARRAVHLPFSIQPRYGCSRFLVSLCFRVLWLLQYVRWRMIDVIKLNYVKLAFNSGRTSGLVHNPSLVSLARTPLEFLIVFRACDLVLRDLYTRMSFSGLMLALPAPMESFDQSWALSK